MREKASWRSRALDPTRLRSDASTRSHAHDHSRIRGAGAHAGAAADAIDTSQRNDADADVPERRTGGVSADAYDRGSGVAQHACLQSPWEEARRVMLAHKRCGSHGRMHWTNATAYRRRASDEKGRLWARLKKPRPNSWPESCSEMHRTCLLQNTPETAVPLAPLHASEHPPVEEQQGCDWPSIRVWAHHRRFR